MFIHLAFLCLFLSIFTDASLPRRRSGGTRRQRVEAILEREQDYASLSGSSTEALCASDPAKNVAAPKKNIWWGLTAQESEDVYNWVVDQKELNITSFKKAKGHYARANIVTNVELMQPNKTAAVNYAEGNGPEPARYAHVLLSYNSGIEPYYQNLLVGPLPVKKGVTKYEALSYPYTKQSKGKIRNLESRVDDLYGYWLFEVGKSVVDITMDLWNGTAAGYKNDTIYASGTDPLGQDDGITSWFGFYSDKEGTNDDTYTLLPLGLYFQGNLTDRDPKKWELMGWLYNDVFYKTTQDFKKAFYSKTNPLPRLRAVPQGEWANTGQRGRILPLDRLFPPTLEAPGGSRFFVDRDEQYVKWMDFEFYLSFSDNTAMRLYNIKYKGERIIYELGLQEALAHYAGNDPVQSGTSYLDSYYGFGNVAFSLVPGWDCPTYSTFLSSAWWGLDNLRTRNHTICLFEMDAGYPIQRHTSDYIAITKNNFLTLRSVSTVGNYDYMFSYEFYMDGSMHVDVRASGYIEAAYNAKNEEYGYTIHENLSGSMHDHVLNYKVDFDILGTKNTMQTVTNVPISQVYPWSHGKPRNTMKLQTDIIKSEDESKLFWPNNMASQYKIVNNDRLNKFGEAPGYRIYPSSGAIHCTVHNSSNLAKAIQWSSHDLYITKQKDTEPRSVNPYNNQDVYAPLVEFDKFFDGESLEQEDLVAWFNLGMHHVPNTGDLPNTVFTTAHSGVTFMPVNYGGDVNPIMESLSQIRLHTNNGKTTAQTYGQNAGDCKIPYSLGEGPKYGTM